MGTATIPVFVAAGDPSGDIAGSHLIRRLKDKNDKLIFIGLGGQRMRREGQEQLIDGSSLAVLGFWEVARKALFFRKLFARTVALIEKARPAVVVLIDYPGFNLKLAGKVRTMNIPIVYYISPQIWAWGARRMAAIKRSVDLMLVILPFEKKLYDNAGVSCRFVGHYLLDDIDKAFIKADYNVHSDLITLMPGSRPQEVRRMLPVLLDAAGLLCAGGKRRFAVAGVSGNIDYESSLRRSRVPVDLVFGKTRELIAESRLVLTSSGTATLEAGIIGRPMVVIYKTGVITYTIARFLVKLNKIALINIAAGRRIVPELVQYAATPERIARAAAAFLENDELSLKVTAELNRVVDTLGSKGAADRAADAVREYLQC
jgi:lipid-A-disaccharide synthase